MAPRRSRESDDGFTLVELLMVVTILPLIVGALSAGLIAVFSLQSGVAGRLSHTADAQAVSVNFARDIQGAGQVTTDPSGLKPACAVPAGGTQLLGLESDLATSGVYQTIISYYSIPEPATASAAATNEIVRTYCTGANTTVAQSSEILAFDVSVAGTQTALHNSVMTVTCVNGQSSLCANASTGWVGAQNVSTVSFAIDDQTNNDPYTVVGSPIASTSTTNNGSPINSKATSACQLATPGSGNLAATLCFVDFSSVTGSALLATQNGGCLEMSVALPDDYTMYFCMSMSGAKVLPWYMPTYSQAFLGNTIGGQPFYTGVAGSPALYQRAGGTSVITFSDISVVSPLGVPATGWEAVSTDAESTDSGESINWTSDADLNVIANGEAGQIQPMGNACLDDGTLPNGASGLTGNGTTSVTCSGTVTVSGTTYNITNGQKTGAAMVWAAAPTTMTVTMVGTGLEAISFGMLLP
jgi:prepilin-type N-terminal cleavage/methylation domain-containing protein